MKTISVEDLRKKLENDEILNLVDVREDHERLEFNIGGIHHRLGLIQTMQTEPLDDMKEEEVYLYCRSGNRSGQAALMLESMGFKNVINVTGGMLAWQEKFSK
jgi:rhodanese-related sulfurtransferase